MLSSLKLRAQIKQVVACNLGAGLASIFGPAISQLQNSSSGRGDEGELTETGC